MRNKRGFTLIELLVVIAILAILAAFLFPVFAAAKRQAKKTTALSNLEQIGKAALLYTNDNNDHLPFRFPGMPDWPGYDIAVMIHGPGLSVLFQPYIADSNVWYSPEDRLPDKGFTSFAMNEQLAYDWSMGSIPRPSEAIYFTDRTDVNDLPAGDTYLWWLFTDQRPFVESSLPGTIDPIVVASQIDPIRYVGDVGIYQFLDSHAKALPFMSTWGDATHNLHLATKS